LPRPGARRMAGGKPPPSAYGGLWCPRLLPNKRRIRGRAFLGLVGVLLLVGLIRLWSPLATIRAQGDRIAQLNLKKAALLSEQADLERGKQRLATEEGRKAAARRQGYVKKGERRIVFFREKKPATGSGAEASEATATGKKTR